MFNAFYTNYSDIIINGSYPIPNWYDLVQLQ